MLAQAKLAMKKNAYSLNKAMVWEVVRISALHTHLLMQSCVKQEVSYSA
jgi:hypothetical protein